MGEPQSPSLTTLTEEVRSGLFGLYANLRRNPYKANVVRPLHASAMKLCDIIQEELSRNPYHPNKRAIRDALSSLRSVEGSIQLLITASDEYSRSTDLAEKHLIQNTWTDRKDRLVGQAEPCAESLDVVLAFADDLDSQASTGEINLPDKTANRKRRGRAG